MTIEAPSGNSGNAFCTVKSVPLTLIPNVLSKCASVICPSGINSPRPALAKRTSMRPFSCFTVAIEIGEIGDVAPDRGDVFADLLHRGIEFGLTAAGDEDIRAFFNETLGGAKPISLLPPVITAILPASLFDMEISPLDYLFTVW